ncbi:MAG: hypothetical protein R3C01_09160 [Planctomycetaceae bacterium]
MTNRSAIGRSDSWEPEDYDCTLLKSELATYENLLVEWEATGSCPDCGVYLVENSAEVRKHDFFRDVHEYLVAGDEGSLTVITPRFDWQLLSHNQTGDSSDRI